MRILLLVIASTMFFSCKKDQKMTSCTDMPVEKITPEISNFKFKTGTYWVYVDPVSLQIDTMKVENTSETLVGNSKCDNQKHEYYTFSVNKKYGLTSSFHDTYSLRGNGLMLNQTTELGNNYVFLTTSPKMDSLFIYDRYYKSVVVANLGTTKLYYNTTYGLLKIEDSNGVKVLKDKLIIR
jgi:hypothetical protein